MIISEIVKDKKHLVKVCFFGGEEILLDKDVCADNALCANMELTEEEVQKLIYTSDFTRAKSRALWYLDRNDYTEKAVYTKLLQAKFPKKASAAAVGRLVEIGIIDDRRFAERFFEKCAERNLSKRETFHKMMEKGVPYDLAKEILENGESDEEEQIRNLLNGKYASKLMAENGKQKVFAALARKGFSFSSIRSVMNEVLEDLEFCEEYDV